MPPFTSDSHPIYVTVVDTSRPGHVALTFAPGKHDEGAYSGATWARDLRTDLDRLVSEYRTGLLVVLLSDHELAMLGIPDLVAEAEKRMQVLRLPIPDGGVPSDVAAVRELVMAIGQAAAEGKNVVIHCRGGLGRAGLIGGCFLASLGLSEKEVFARLARRHPTSCPETQAQREWIRGFCASFRTAGGS